MIALDSVADILKAATREFILPRYRSLRDDEISTKTGPRDLVTQADIDMENHLKEILPKLLKGSVVLGEEGVSSGEASLDLLKETACPLWVVDPVDGTYNFVHGRDVFGVMLALIVEGQTVAGWIYDVPADEMTISERGAGAFLEGRKLKVSSMPDAQDYTGFMNPRFFLEQHQDHIHRIKAAFKNCRSLGCAAHEYLRIAKGEAQFSLYSHLKPWDHLAGALMVQEAGGYVAKWDATPYQSHEYDVGLITAPSQADWEKIHAVFFES